MNYQEAIKLAQAWTKDHDVRLDGWRSVILLLSNRITVLETTNQNLHDHISKLQHQIDALSLDLGIKDQDFRLPDQPQLKTIADIIRETESKPLP